MDSKEKIKKLKIYNLPTRPGVYQFFGSGGETLYIGKAKNLRSRVKSYFLRAEELRESRSEAIFQMVSQIQKIKATSTDSEIEAVILEAELINRQKPKYNTRQKDDKSFYLIQIKKADISSVELVRSRNVDLKNKEYKYFGPYPSGEVVKKALKILRKIFPYADCSKIKFTRQKKLAKGCLYGDLSLCLSQCAGENTLESKRQIKYLIDFLSGKKKKVIQNLNQEMATLSQGKKFEKAAVLRDKIFALEHLNRYPLGLSDSFSGFRQFSIFPRIEAYDVSNIGGEYAVGAMTVVSLGDIDKSEYKKFKIQTISTSNDIAMMQEMIRRRMKNRWPQASLMVIDGGVGHLNAVKKILKEFSSEIPLVSIAKGSDRKKNELHFSGHEIAKYFKNNDELKRIILQVRDEAHRFSREYYRKLHRKGLRK